MSKIVNLYLDIGNYSCNYTFGKYSHNGQNHLIFNDSHNDDPVAIASVCIPHELLTDDEIAIKDYSENKGMLENLTRLGMISEPLRFIDSGYVQIPICKILSKD